MKKNKSRYSVLVIGSIENVKSIAKKHGIDLKRGNFAGDKGYTFEVEEEILGEHPLVKALNKSKDVFGVTLEYGAMGVPKAGIVD